MGWSCGYKGRGWLHEDKRNKCLQLAKAHFSATVVCVQDQRRDENKRERERASVRCVREGEEEREWPGKIRCGEREARDKAAPSIVDLNCKLWRMQLEPTPPP